MTEDFDIDLDLIANFPDIRKKCHYIKIPTTLVRHLHDIKFSKLWLSASPWMGWQQPDFKGITWYYFPAPWFSTLLPIEEFTQERWKSTFDYDEPYEWVSYPISNPKYRVNNPKSLKVPHLNMVELIVDIDANYNKQKMSDVPDVLIPLVEEFKDLANRICIDRSSPQNNYILFDPTREDKTLLYYQKNNAPTKRAIWSCLGDGILVAMN